MKEEEGAFRADKWKPQQLAAATIYSFLGKQLHQSQQETDCNKPSGYVRKLISSILSEKQPELMLFARPMALATVFKL